jgi:type VI secretion system protein
MPLTLKITSKQRHILGADSMRVFSVHGGSIGRAPDNDWVLPDPDRYISGHHAAIDYRAGNYYLRDNSTNGVFVNHSSEPVGRGTPIRLYDGDELRMGDYVFEVSVVNVSPDGSDDSGQGPEEERPERRLKRRQPAAPLSLKLLGEEADQMHVAAQEMMAGRKAPALDEEPVIQIDEREFGNTVVASGSRVELSPDEAVPELPSVGFRPAAKPAFTPTDGQDFSAAVRLLLESAGLDARRLPHGDEQQTMVTVGRFIRATVAGLQSALQTRTLIKTQFQLDLTGMQAVNNNPLKFIPDTQEALEELFYRESEGYLGPTEAVENAVEGLRTHPSAMVKGMQAAFRVLLERLSPDVLEEKFEGKVKRGGGLLTLSGKSNNHWELYREAYEQLTGLSDDILLKMVTARFAEAYEAEMQYLKVRKGVKGRPG